MKEITLEATVENIAVVTDFINEELNKVNCSENIKSEIDIAVDEIFGNIANYAYGENTGKAIVQIEITNNPMKAIITFIDNGIKYNPLEKENPDITLSAEDRKIGGLGVYIVKKIMNDVLYEYIDNSNILKIVKSI